MAENKQPLNIHRGPIEMHAVESSQIKALGYDVVSQTLAIIFNSGAEYRYEGVEAKLYDAFIRAPSVGSFFYRNIKNVPETYPYEKMAEAGEIVEPEVAPRQSVTHRVKSWVGLFEPVDTRRKTFEVRLNDRDYQVGDYLEPHEWDPETQKFTGKSCTRIITYVMRLADLPTEIQNQLGVNPAPGRLREVVFLALQ